MLQAGEAVALPYSGLFLWCALTIGCAWLARRGSRRAVVVIGVVSMVAVSSYAWHAGYGSLARSGVPLTRVWSGVLLTPTLPTVTAVVAGYLAGRNSPTIGRLSWRLLLAVLAVLTVAWVAGYVTFGYVLPLMHAVQ